MFLFKIAYFFWFRWWTTTGFVDHRQQGSVGFTLLKTGTGEFSCWLIIATAKKKKKKVTPSDRWICSPCSLISLRNSSWLHFNLFLRVSITDIRMGKLTVLSHVACHCNSVRKKKSNHCYLADNIFRKCCGRWLSLSTWTNFPSTIKQMFFFCSFFEISNVSDAVH